MKYFKRVIFLCFISALVAFIVGLCVANLLNLALVWSLFNIFGCLGLFFFACNILCIVTEVVLTNSNSNNSVYNVILYRAILKPNDAVQRTTTIN